LYVKHSAETSVFLGRAPFETEQTCGLSSRGSDSSSAKSWECNLTNSLQISDEICVFPSNGEFQSSAE
jgi:hypothetical protein